MSRVLPILFNGDMVRAILDGRKTVTRRVIKLPHCGYFENEPPRVAEPYQKNDILYVRETWQHLYELDENGQAIDGTGKYYYAATDALPDGTYIDSAGRTHECIPWRPSIHMPKQAARIWLRVTDVRVERLQEITWDGILAEGVINQQSNPSMGKRWVNMQRMEFEEVWDSTIKKPELARYGWDANPWVWVIEFERCGKPEGNGK